MNKNKPPTAADLIRKAAADNPEAHNDALARGYGVDGARDIRALVPNRDKRDQRYLLRLTADELSALVFYAATSNTSINELILDRLTDLFDAVKPET